MQERHITVESWFCRMSEDTSSYGVESGCKSFRLQRLIAAGSRLRCLAFQALKGVQFSPQSASCR